LVTSPAIDADSSADDLDCRNAYPMAATAITPITVKKAMVPQGTCGWVRTFLGRAFLHRAFLLRALLDMRGAFRVLWMTVRN
jgi:hypothetical protein